MSLIELNVKQQRRCRPERRGLHSAFGGTQTWKNKMFLGESWSQRRGNGKENPRRNFVQWAVKSHP